MNNKRLNLLPVWAAISAVIIIAGIVLMALLGFNNSLDRPESKNFDVYYNVVVDLSEERKATLEGYCEDAFAAQGIAYEEKTTLSGQTDPVSQNQSSFTGTGNDFVLRYTFSADVSDEALAAAKAAVEANIGGNQEFSPDYNGAETSVSYYTLELQAMNESVWRGAIAVAVGAIVALIYVAIRFGMGCALTGLVACVNDAFLTLSVFAIARIPVYTFAHDGARFCICAGEPLRVAREGEIAYELALDPRAESDAVIRSPFGEIPVRVRTLRAECVREGERLALDCAYLLDFSGELQRHRLRFTVRPQAAEKEGKDDR